MATLAQITANRLNAQKSTGPRSAEGKAAARFNSVKHGLDAESLLLPGEDPAEYEKLAADYRAEFHPATPSENFHVETMIRADWHKRRFEKLEAETYRIVIAESPTGNWAEAILSGSAGAKLLHRTQQKIAALEKT